MDDRSRDRSRAREPKVRLSSLQKFTGASLGELEQRIANPLLNDNLGGQPEFHDHWRSSKLVNSLSYPLRFNTTTRRFELDLSGNPAGGSSFVPPVANRSGSFAQDIVANAWVTLLEYNGQGVFQSIRLRAENQWWRLRFTLDGVSQVVNDAFAIAAITYGMPPGAFLSGVKNPSSGEFLINLRCDFQHANSIKVEVGSFTNDCEIHVLQWAAYEY